MTASPSPSTKGQDQGTNNQAPNQTSPEGLTESNSPKQHPFQADRQSTNDHTSRAKDAEKNQEIPQPAPVTPPRCSSLPARPPTPKGPRKHCGPGFRPGTRSTLGLHHSNLKWIRWCDPPPPPPPTPTRAPRGRSRGTTTTRDESRHHTLFRNALARHVDFQPRSTADPYDYRYAEQESADDFYPGP